MHGKGDSGDRPAGPSKDDNRPWRRKVGGMWDAIGRLQLEFLRSKGLKPGHRLLDVGCGCLRGGVHFVRHLADGNYYGIDRNEDLLEAGRTLELAEAGLADRSVSLSCREDFDATGFGVRFDFAVAHSLFTHLPWNSILRCLIQVERVLAPGGQLFATFFEDPDGSHATAAITHQPGGITTWPDKNPYHYEFSIFGDLARRAGLDVEYLGDWNHPRNQKMMVFRHRRAAALSAASGFEPAADTRLSLVVVVHDMEREAPRTLHTLSPGYQGVAADQYEVLVVDNGSARPLGREYVEAIAPNFRYLYLEPGNPSPVEALNRGAGLSRGRQLGFMIDGARMLSPGVIQYALRAGRAYRNPVVSTIGYHLGPEPQQLALTKGYGQAAEDRLLDGVDWRRNGYELFRISTLALSSRFGMFGPQAESNCIFVSAPTFAAIGGFHRGFDEPGGGLANLDFFREAIELPGTEWVVLLGEGNFHQFHGGEMTGRSPEDVASKWEGYERRYRSIRNRPFALPLAPCDYLGHAPPQLMPALREALEGYAGFQRAEAEAAVRLDSMPRPPNRLAGPGVPGRPVIILGMHRSGTSMLAGSLQEAGLELGNVVVRAPHNIKGNRENRALFLMQEDLLERNGGSWRNPPGTVVWQALHRAWRDEVVASFAGAEVWGFKDPRTLLTIEGWLEVLPDARLVGIFRHPLPVAESLLARDGIPLPQGLELWKRYNRRLLDLHDARPFPIVEFCDAPDLVRRSLRRLVQLLQLPARYREPRFFDDGLNHNPAGERGAPAECVEMLGELRRRALRA